MDVRFHGNGFIQVYLNSVTRMHIWSPKFPATRVVNAQIHDHRFWFRSKVLLGELFHKEYTVDLDEEGRHGLYRTHGHSKVAPLERVGRCDVVQSVLDIYTTGDEYDFGGPGKYHETNANHLTVTVMSKVKTDPTYFAHIVALNDLEPDHAFGNQPDRELLVIEVQRALAKVVW